MSSQDIGKDLRKDENKKKLMSQNMNLDVPKVLPKTLKIKDFKSFYAEAERSRGRHVLTYSRTKANDPCGQIALAVVASKKGVDKRAVRRNRVKRRLRAAMALVLKVRQSTEQNESSTTIPAIEWCLTGNRSVLNTGWNELLEEVSAVWARIESKHLKNQ